MGSSVCDRRRFEVWFFAAMLCFASISFTLFQGTTAVHDVHENTVQKFLTNSKSSQKRFISKADKEIAVDGKQPMTDPVVVTEASDGHAKEDLTKDDRIEPIVPAEPGSSSSSSSSTTTKATTTTTNRTLHLETSGKPKVVASQSVNEAKASSTTTKPVVARKAPVEQSSSELAGLQCEPHGGPANEVSQEMVYWQDIPQDNKHQSPFRNLGERRYLTFEPDQGGFNNIRMAMETVLALSFAMGRTLVMPPEAPMYLLDKSTNKGKSQRRHFGFDNFFPLELVHSEHVGLDIISMKTYLEREAGNFRFANGTVAWPPENRTDWNGLGTETLFHWLREVSLVTIWRPNDCQVAFPTSTKAEDIEALLEVDQKLVKDPPRFEDFVGKPVPINGTLEERMREHRASRKGLCLYNATMQKAERVHFPVDFRIDARLLAHFYAVLFFQDYRQDLWLKRFVRDHMRYTDEIQCAAARVVGALRKRVKTWSSAHIRRGDFQFVEAHVSIEYIRDKFIRRIKPNSTIYIATDEMNKKVFDPLAKVYNLFFLDDFKEELGDLNSNYYGMVEQLVASRGNIFFGVWFSTFTGYINRMRGYHANKDKVPGYENGIVPETWYYAPDDRYDHMQVYYPLKRELYVREFPTSWRLLEFNLPSFHEQRQQQNSG